MTRAAEGKTRLTMDVDVTLFNEILGLAERLGRPVVDEVCHAMRRHLMAPPEGGGPSRKVPPMARAVASSRKTGGRKAKPRLEHAPCEAVILPMEDEAGGPEGYSTQAEGHVPTHADGV